MALEFLVKVTPDSDVVKGTHTLHKPYGFQLSWL